MRNLYDRLVILCGLAMVAVAMLLFSMLPASAQLNRPLTEADMRIDTPCFKSGAGRNPRTQAIVEAQIPAQRVGKDGYWQLCEEHAELRRQVGDITRGTACGQPAVGIHPVTGVIYATSNPREYVSADGVWQRCDQAYTPVKPVHPKEVTCAVADLKWSAATEPGLYVPSDSQACSAAVGRSIKPGQSLSVTNMGVGEYQGTLLVSCAPDGRLNVALATCQKADACIVSAWRASDDGGATWWSYQGRLLEGATSQATGPDGKTRPVQCIGGRLRLM